MFDFERIQQMALSCGFTNAGVLDASTLKLLPEVRAMCAQGKCGRYGHSWCCPPAIGDLEECGRKLSGYHRGIIVQTVGELEDEFDGEGMMETEARQKEAFYKMKELLEREFPKMLSLGSGTCTRCSSCTYPDAPCRFPEDTFASMEAFGLLVSDVCKANQVTYNYGRGFIAYTGCFLLE